MRHYYDNDLVDYFGVNKIKDFLCWKYYWIGINNDVLFYCFICDVCQRINF